MPFAKPFSTHRESLRTVSQNLGLANDIRCLGDFSKRRIFGEVGVVHGFAMVKSVKLDGPGRVWRIWK